MRTPGLVAPLADPDDPETGPERIGVRFDDRRVRELHLHYRVARATYTPRETPRPTKRR